jgi:NAD/NADP transhydrogenase alpha subunit
MSQHLWLRCEKKEFERRAALSPGNAKALIDAGFTIHVERDEQRIFDDSEYESYAPYFLIIRTVIVTSVQVSGAF